MAFKIFPQLPIRLIRRIRLIRLIRLISLLAVALLATAGLFFLTSDSTTEAWFNDNWAYRQPFTFTHNADISAERAVTFSLDTAELITGGVMQSDCDDTRFTDINGKLLRYQLTGTCNNAATTYEVVFPSIINGSNGAYVYYGNPSAVSASEDVSSVTALTPSGGDPSITTRTSEEKSTGPVGYWKFDEGVDNTCSGGTNDACDSTESTLDAAMTGGTWQPEDMCISGKCMFFDGSDDVATATNANPVDFDTGLVSGVTFASWVRVNSDGEGSVGEILDKGASTYIRITNEGSDGLADLEVSLDLATADATVTVTNGITLNHWHHISVGYTDDGDDEVTVYIDGLQRGASTNGDGAPAGTDSNNLLIGGSSTANFHGFIDEFKVYHYERSAAQVKLDAVKEATPHGAAAAFGLNTNQSGANLAQGLVGYWRLDESSGDASDSSGNQTTLTNVSSTAYSGAKFGNGIEPDGTADYLHAADNTSLSVTGSLTLAAWIEPDDVTGTENIIAKWDGTSESYRLTKEAANVRMYIDSDSNYQATTGSPLATNTKAHVVGVYDAESATVKIYVNGVEVTSATTGTIPSSIGDDTGQFQLAAEDHNNTPKNFFDGHIDEARVYNRALAPDEVQALYNFAPMPIAHWKLDENKGSPEAAADMLVYRGGGDTSIPEYKQHDANWGTEGTAQDVDSGGVGVIEWIKVVAKPDPNSDEKVMCAKDSLDDVNCQVWDGSSWGNLIELSTTVNAQQSGFDIAYEQNSGHAMVCYREPTDTSIPFCDIWNGSNWNTAADASDVVSPIASVRLIADPNSDYIALMTKDVETTPDINVQIWDGSSWGNLLEVETDATTAPAPLSYDGVWDSNGDFMAIWFSNSDDELEARQFDKSTGWGTQVDGVITGLTTDVDMWVHTAAHPNNGEILVTVEDDDDTLTANFWNGSSWGTQEELEDQAGFGIGEVNFNSNLHHLAYEQSGDMDAILTYGKTGSALHYRVWDTGTSAWGSEQNLPTSTDNWVDWFQLASDPKSDNIMLTLLGSVDAVDTLEWSGSAWEAAFTNQETTSDDVQWNAWFTYDYRPDAPADTSGNGNSGRMDVTMTESDWAPGKYGSALDFDGTDDAVTITDASDSYVDFNGTEAFSGGAWVYIKTMPGSGNQDAIISKYDETSTLRGYRLVVENDDADTTGNFQVEIYDESANQAIIATGANDTVNENTWYHVSFSFNGGVAGTADDLKLYTNGVFTDGNDANASFLGLEDVAVDFTLGNYDATDVVANNTPFAGNIDDVLVYNYARTPGQVIQDMNAGHPAPGSPVGSAVGYWKFDEGYGTTTNDASINNNDLSFTDAPAWTQQGKYGNALDFERGSSNYLSVADSASLSITGDVTLSSWIKPESTTAATSFPIVGKWDAATTKYSYLLTQYGDEIRMYVGSDTAYATTNSSNLQTGTWYYVAGVYSASSQTVTLYVDGKKQVSTTTGTIPSSIADDTQNLHVGLDGVSTTEQTFTIQANEDDGFYYDIWYTSGFSGDNYNYMGRFDPNSDYSGLRFTGVTVANAATVLSAKFQLYGTYTNGSAWPIEISADDNAATITTTNPPQFGSSDLPQNITKTTAIVNWSPSSWPTGQYNDTADITDIIQEIVNRADWDSGDVMRFALLDNGAVSGAEIGFEDYAHASSNIAKLVITTAGAAGNNYYDGIIDEVKVYPSALTGEQIAVDANQGKAVVMGSLSQNTSGTGLNSNASSYCAPGDSDSCVGPVGEWKMDENTGTTTTYDTSGNGNNGTMNGSMTASDWVPGKFGSALDFDGTDDYVDLGFMDVSGSALTISARFKADAFITVGAPDNDPRILSKANSTTEADHYWMLSVINSSGNDRLRFRLKTGGTTTTHVATSGNLSTATWYYATVTYDDSTDTVKMFLDGIEVYSGTQTGTLSTSGAVGVNIGRNPDGYGEWDGILDDVRIYNYARTPAQIAWEYNRGAPIAWYKFDECSGSTANNSAPAADGDSGNDGTIFAGDSTGTNDSVGSCNSGAASPADEMWDEGTTGKRNASLDFDNTNDYVQVSDAAALDFVDGEDFSITGWVKASALSDNNAIVSKKNGVGTGSGGYMFYVNTSGQLASYISDATDDVSLFTDVTISAGTWYHVALVYKDDSDVDIYINGLNGGGSVTGTIANVDSIANAVNFVVGSESDLDVAFMDGQLDEIKLFRYALTKEQIQADYAGGAVGFR